MKALYDTNIILDVLLRRKPFDSESAKLMSYVEEREVTGLLCATTLTTIHYIVTRQYDRSQSLNGIKRLLKIFDVASVNHVVLDRATQSKFTDFEDAVLYESAKLAKVDAIVTRNSRDFKSASFPIYTPHEFLAILTPSQPEDED